MEIQKIQQINEQSQIQKLENYKIYYSDQAKAQDSYMNNSTLSTVESKNQQSRENFKLEKSIEIELETQNDAKDSEQEEIEVELKHQLNKDTLSIIRYLKNIEIKHQDHNFIYNPLRAVTIDWIIGNSIYLKLRCTTLFIAVQLFDIYISKEEDLEQSQEQFKLILGTLLFIAAKYEEVIPPKLNQFSKILQIQQKLLLKQEIKMIVSLGFNFSNPTILVFLETYMSQIQFNEYQENLARYLIHLSLYDSRFKRIASSQIAAASILVVLKVQNMEKEDVWGENLQYITEFPQCELELIANSLYILLIQVQQSQQSAVFLKFALPHFYSISKKYSFTTSQNNLN